MNYQQSTRILIKLRLTHKYRLYPTKAQAEFLTGELKEACSLYNAALEERIGAWKTCRKSINYYDQARQIKAMRIDGCLTLTNYACTQEVLRKLDRTFRAFFRRVKLGMGKVGFPRFKSFLRYDSIVYPSAGRGIRLLDTGKIRVQGAGHIRIKLHRPLEGKVKTVTIKRDAERWFACFNVEVENNPLTATNTSTGVDVGLSSFAVLANGVGIKNPRYYRKAEARLRRCQRRVARRKRGSSRRRKAVLLLQRAHAHVRNQRADFLHKESRKLVNEYGTIAVESLNVKKLASGKLAKSVHDAGWSSFITMLTYKAECAGRRVVKVDARGTSQTCICGERVPKTLRDRWHDCPACGLSAGRDHVSAQVILQRAGVRPSGANAEVVDSYVARETVLT